MRQEVYHLESSQVQSILLQLLKCEDLARVGAFVNYLLDQVNLVVYLFYFQPRDHLAPLNCQDILKLSEKYV